MVQSKVIMSLWWKDMDFKKKRVPREKSGRHSNLIYLVLKPLLKNPGRHSVIFSISKMFFIIVQCFFILKMVFIDFSLFWRCCSLLFNDFSLFSRCFKLFFIDCSMCLHDFHHFSLIFQCFKDSFHYFSLYCWVDFMHTLHICSIYGRHGTVENSIIWSFGVFRTT